MPISIPSVSPSAVRRALRDRAEIGLLDVRPEGRFAEGHPLFAASFPLGRLEAEVFDRLPRRSVPLVVYGDGAGAGADDAARPDRPARHHRRRRGGSGRGRRLHGQGDPIPPHR